jgi:hypothetical protein
MTKRRGKLAMTNRRGGLAMTKRRVGSPMTGDSSKLRRVLARTAG